MSHECADLLRLSSDCQFGGGAHSHVDGSPMPMKKYKEQKRRLDLAYLYADPLMEKQKNNALVPINQPLDTDKELREI